MDLGTKNGSRKQTTRRDKQSRRWTRRCIRALLLAVLLVPQMTSSAPASGGDLVWDRGDPQASTDQEALAMTLDSSGNLIITGKDSTNPDFDFYTSKFSADGTSILWNMPYDAPSEGNDTAVDVVVDSNDDVIIVGDSWNSTNLDFDFLAIKYNEVLGTVATGWPQFYAAPAGGDDRATAVAVDGSDNIYIAGYGQGSTTGDDYILVKYLPDGTLDWAVSYDDSSGVDKATDVAWGGGGVVVVGESQSSALDLDCAIIKYDATSAVSWTQRRSDLSNDSCDSVHIDASGDVIVVGRSFNGLDWDMFVEKRASATGALIWDFTRDSGRSEELHGIATDTNGDVYVTGHAFSVATADDVYTAKLDGTLGTLEWSDTHNTEDGNGDRGVSLVVSASFDVFVLSDTYDATTDDYNYVLLKYAGTNGNLVWEQTFDGTASKNDRSVGLGFTPTGEVTVGGWSDMWTSSAQDYDFYGVSYDPGMLNRPTNLIATASAVDEVTLSWDDNSGNEDNFEVERRTLPSGPWGWLRTESADATGCVDDTAAASTEYYYRVRATNTADGESDYSDEVYVATSAASFGAPDWTYTFNGTYDGDDFVSGVAIGYDNNPVVVGSTIWDTQFDYLTIKVDRATAIAQWTAREDVEWAAETDHGKAIAVDTNNEIIVTGYTYQGMSVRNDIHTMKYAATGGDETWGIGYNHPVVSDDDRAVAVAISPDGSGYVVVGYGKNAAWDNDIYVLKYTTGGVLDWAATPFGGAGADEDQATALAIDTSGDIYVVGWTTGSSNIDIYTARYNGTTGVPVWTEIHPGAGGGAGDDYGYAVSVGYAAVCISGKTRMATGDDDVITICYDKADGDLLWDPTWNGAASGDDEAIGVEIDPFNGDVVVTGTSLVGVGNNDLTALRYDSDGNLLWEKTVGRPGFDDTAVAGTIGPAGNIYIAGDTEDGSGFDAIAVIFDEYGDVIGGTTVDEAAGDEDRVTSLAVSNHGEAFIGGKTKNSSGNYDYLLFRIHHNLLRAPAPLVATPNYRGILLEWGDNSTDEEGFTLERKDGTCDSANPWQSVYDATAGEDSYNDLGMPVNTSYCYRVTAYKDGGATVSRPAIAETGTLLPIPPGNLDVTVLDTTTLRLTWTDNTNGEQGFRIQRCGGTDCTDFADIDTTGSNVTTRQDPTACRNTEYRYRVMAFFNGTVDTEWSSEYSTPDSATTPQAFAPTDVTATRISEAQIDLEWTDTTFDETGFLIERCEGAGCDVFVEIHRANYNSTAYSDMTAVPGAINRYQISSYKTTNCSWQLTSAPPVEETATITPPSGLAATVANTTTIDLVWIDNTASETGFEIWRCEGTGCTPDTLIFTTAAEIEIYQDTLACESTIYRYAVRATGGPWFSNYSNITSDTLTTTPDSPTGLTATPISESQIDLSWSDTNGDETGFIIERCEGSTCTDFAEIKTVLPDSSEYSDVGVTPDTTYRYQVVTEKASGCPWTRTSNIAIATSNSATAPTNLIVTAAHSTQLDLTWDDNTESETGYIVERCEGSSCGGIDFAEVAMTGPQATQYSDETACHTTTYRYRVKAVNEGLSNNGENCWTRRAPLTITGLITGAFIKVTVAHTSDMQADFDDLRFFDEAAGLELPYWLKNKTDSVSATFWVKAGSNDTINMYYGNPSATSSSNAENLAIEFVDDFRGSTIDATKWEEIDPDNSIGQNNNLNLNDVSDGWNKALISQQTFERAPDKNLYVSLTIANDTNGTNRFMIGWEIDQITDPSYTQLVHGLYWNNRTFTTFEKTTNTGPNSPAYAWNTSYEMSVKLKSTGAQYYIRGGVYGSWTLVQETSTHSDATMRVAFTQNSHKANIHLIAVTGDDFDLQSATVGTEEGTGCFTFDGNWETGYSNEDDDTTPTPAAPVITAATGQSESMIELTWNDNSLGETGFEIEMCEGVGCTVMSYIDTADPDATSFEVVGLNPETRYRFQMRAVSTESCPWQTAFSAIVDGDTIGPAEPTDLVATPIHSTQIDLTWIAHTNAETNFVLQRCEGSGCTSFTDLATDIAPGSDFYSDTTVCDGLTYRYQIRADRTIAPTWQTPWSLPAEGTAPQQLAPSGLVGTWISEIAMTLDWTDNSPDEDGFSVEACIGVGCINFVEIGTTLAGETTLALPDVIPGVTYNFRARGTKAASCPWSTNPVYSDPATVFYTTILEPNSVTATAADTTTVNLTWTDRTVSEAGFTVERCEGSGCDFSCSVTFDVGPNDEIEEPIVSFTDLDAWEGTLHRYRVRAYGTSAGGPWTSPWSSTIDEPTPGMVTPSSFNAEVLTDIEVTLTWTDMTADETGFKFERCQGQGCSNFTTLPVSVGADVEIYIDNNGVLPQTWYTYRVKAFKTATHSWETLPSATSTVFTSSAAPTDLVVTAINSQVIQLDWTDLSTDEDGFHVEKQIWNGTYVLIGIVGAGITTFTDAIGIQGDTFYRYRVRAYRGSDPSSYAYGSVTTPPWDILHNSCL